MDRARPKSKRDNGSQTELPVADLQVNFPDSVLAHLPTAFKGIQPHRAQNHGGAVRRR
jgi:hypothetical protein